LFISSLLAAYGLPYSLPAFPTRRSSDLPVADNRLLVGVAQLRARLPAALAGRQNHCSSTNQNALKYPAQWGQRPVNPCLRIKYRSEEHTSELQSRENLVCRLLLEKKKIT